MGREESCFWLQKKTEKATQNLWYRDHMNGWIKAETAKLGEKISTHAFEFTFRPEDSIIEGIAVIAFVDEGKLPTERKCRELNVHIW